MWPYLLHLKYLELVRECLIAISMTSSYNYHKPLGMGREETQVDLYGLGESCN